MFICYGPGPSQLCQLDALQLEVDAQLKEIAEFKAEKEKRRVGQVVEMLSRVKGGAILKAA